MEERIPKSSKSLLPENTEDSVVIMKSKSESIETDLFSFVNACTLDHYTDSGNLKSKFSRNLYLSIVNSKRENPNSSPDLNSKKN